MKFRITSEHLYWWPVTVRMPSETEPGTMDEFGFKGQFRTLSPDDTRALRAFVLDQADLGNDGTEAESVRRVLVGWDADVADEKGFVPFSAEALERAITNPWFRKGVLLAYRESLQGGGPAAGN